MLIIYSITKDSEVSNKARQAYQVPGIRVLQVFSYT